MAALPDRSGTGPSGTGLTAGLGSAVTPPVTTLTPGPDGTWLADGKPLDIRSLPGDRPGIALLNDSDWNTLGSRDLLPPGASTAVVVRGAGDVVHAPARNPDGTTSTVALTPDQLATIIGEPGTPIALVSCDTGTLAGGFAHQIARAHRGDVLAPTAGVVIGSDAAPGQIVTPNGESWQLYTSDAVSDEGWDVVNDVQPFDGISATPATDDTGLHLAASTPSPATDMDWAPAEAPTEAPTEAPRDAADPGPGSVQQAHQAAQESRQAARQAWQHLGNHQQDLLNQLTTPLEQNQIGQALRTLDQADRARTELEQLAQQERQRDAQLGREPDPGRIALQLSQKPGLEQFVAQENAARQILDGLNASMADRIAGLARTLPNPSPQQQQVLTQLHTAFTAAAEGPRREQQLQEQLRPIAQQVIAETKQRLNLGSANQVTELARSGGVTKMYLEQIRDGGYDRPVSNQLEQISQQAYLADHFRVGNCGENASLAYSLLWNRLPGIPITKFGHSADHAFVIVGDPTNPNSIVVDSWPHDAVRNGHLAMTVGDYLPGSKSYTETDHFTATSDGSDLIGQGAGTVDVDAVNSVMDLDNDSWTGDEAQARFGGGLPENLYTDHSSSVQGLVADLQAPYEGANTEAETEQVAPAPPRDAGGAATPWPGTPGPAGDVAAAAGPADVTATSTDTDVAMDLSSPPALSEVPPAVVAKSTAETPTCGDPIDVTTGRMIYTETDATLPGLTLQRSHRSDYRWGRSFGRSWASTLDQRIVTDDRHAWFLAADGSVLTYPLPAEGDEVLPVLGRAVPLRRLVGGGWLLTDRDRLLLFAPSANGGDALLSDVASDGVRWRISRADDETPAYLESSSGDLVELFSADGLVTGARFVPSDEADEIVELPSFGYDDRRDLVEIRNSSGEAVLLRYDDAGRVVRWDDRNGEWYTYTYDEAGRCILADGRGGFLRYAFEYGDGVTIATDSLGGVHRYELNDRLQVIAITDPLGSTTRTERDAANRLLSHTDPLGRATRYAYDERGRPTSMTRPDSSRTTVAYDGSGRAVSLTGFDGTKQVIGTPTAAVPEERFDLDGLGRPRLVRLPDGTATEFGWTAEGDLAWRIGPDGSLQEWHYDGEGNLMESIDASGRAVSFEYGPFDLPTARVDEAGNRTEFGYDTELRLTEVTNPAGRTWRYTYDAAGRLAEETDFDGRTQRYTHDAAGQLVAHANAAGETTHYTWDVLGRVIERRIGAAVTRLEYDAEGRLAGVTNPDAAVRFERDEQGRIVNETINGRTVRTSYHNDSGMVAARTTPSGRSSRWEFDADGRPASLVTGSHLLQFGHDAAGREISQTVDDVVSLRQTFDDAGRLAVQHIADAAERRFTYDATGRVTAIADSLDGGRSFVADEVGRIHTVAVDGATLERYEYDEVGSLVGAGGGRWRFDGTMLVRSDDAVFDYDDKGRLIGRVDQAGAWRFAWDAEDRMVQATTPGGERWRYRYDGFGRRIAKQRLADDDTVVEEVDFCWSGDLMVEQRHRNADGTSTTSWDYRPDDSAPVAQTDDETLRTVVTDLIGTPTHLVEASGSLRWWSRGDLWGRGHDATDVATPLRFPGQYFDAETGLHYNRFRYYDPTTARYLSADPLGLSGGPNPTSYVPDPLTVADPLGLTSCKMPRPSLTPNPDGTSNPALPSSATPTGQPSYLQSTATPPPMDALYGARGRRESDRLPARDEALYARLHGGSSRSTARSHDAGRESRQLRYSPDDDTYSSASYHGSSGHDTPSPPRGNSVASRMADHAEDWYDDVGYRNRTVLVDPTTREGTRYREVQRNVLNNVGQEPRIDQFANDDETRFADPMMGSLPYNNDHSLARYRGMGDSISDESDGGRRTAAQIANVLNGYAELESITSIPGRQFARVVGFSERGRNYNQEVNRVTASLRQIHSLQSASDAAANWRNVARWFPPALAGYGQAAYVPPSQRPTPQQSVLGPRRAPTARPQPPARRRDDRSRSPRPRPRPGGNQRSSGGGGFWDMMRHPLGSPGPNLDSEQSPFGPTVQPFSAQSDNAVSFADQLAALNGNPDAQAQLRNDFRKQLHYDVPLSNGSTLPVLAANTHGTTAHTDADLNTLTNLDHGYLKDINPPRPATDETGTPVDGQSSTENLNCVECALAVDEFRASGRLISATPTPMPMSLGDLAKSYPARPFTTFGDFQDLANALGAMPNGATGIVAFLPGASDTTTGHAINVTKDLSGSVVFEDGQSGGLATLPPIGPDGSVVFIPTNDPQAAIDVSSTPDHDAETSPSDTNADATTDDDTDSVLVGSPSNYTPTSAPFTDVTPAAVAKTTEQTPTAGDPIDLTTGRMILTHTDAELPGLTLERTYRSDYRWGRSFGRAWASTLDQRIIVDGAQVRYLAADGSMLTYPLPEEGDTALPDAGRAMSLRRLVGGGWLLTDPASDRNLLFAAVSPTESLLTDVTEGSVSWSIVRDDQGTPTNLRSSVGAEIGFSSSAGLVTVLWLPDADGTLLAASRFGYDRELNLIEVVNSSGDPERFTYTDGRIVRWVDRNGEWYTYSYDDAGRCVSTDGKGGYLRYRFDYQPGLTIVTDSLGAVHSYALNDRFQVVAVTDPLGATTHTDFDDAYRLRSQTDPLGRTTAYEYDANGRRTSATRPDGSRSAITYDELGRPISWTDFDGSTRNREFDPDGRVLAETDADGAVVRFDLLTENDFETATQVGPTVVKRNAARLVTSTTTGDAETRYEYDVLGRITGIENAQGTTLVGWTLEGELAWRENPDGSVEGFTYDGEGNLVEAVDANGRWTSTEYGAFDMVTAQIDHEGNRTEYTYDTELRLTTITNPAGETWRYTYDPAGRMVEETDFAGRTHRYAYDAAGQLIAHTNAAGEVTRYTYDLLGQVIERRTGTAVTRLVYDAAGRIVSATDADSEIRLQRDPLGRVVSETVNGRTVTTSYNDRFGAVTTRHRPSGAVTQWSYDESGRPSVLAAGGQQVRFGYAGGHEVSRTSDAGLSLTQSFDELGRLAAQRIDGVTDRRYSYDPAHRLIAVHDEVQGDRTMDPDGAKPGNVRYTLDALGRPVGRSDAAGDWHFVWDHQDRLTAVTTPGGDRWLYRYDAFGRRILKQRLGAAGAVLEQIEFAWSGDLLIEQHHQMVGGKTTTTAWEYHPTAAHPVVQLADGTVHAVVTDGAGIPMDVIGMDGGVTAAPDAIPLRSGGRYLDAETGLHYDRFRYYDPAMDRFLPEPRTTPAPVG